MCVDIGYTTMLGPDGLPRHVKGVKINKDFSLADRDRPHLSAFARPECWVIVQGSDAPEVQPLHWGLIADFMVDRPDQFQKYGNSFFNARSERILEKGSAWFPHVHDRCLLIADGFYEHQKVTGRSRKMPWYVRLATREPLLIPALFNPRTQSFAILTRSGNELLRTIHNDGANKFRMPLLLEPERAIPWIDPTLNHEAIQSILNIEIPSEKLQAHTVYSIRGSALRPDGKEVNEPYDWR